MRLITTLSAAALACAALVPGLALAQTQHDKAFLTKAIEGDNSEVMLGQLAASQGGSQEAKDFGQTLVTDHSQAKQQGSQLASSLGVPVPSGPMPKASREFKKLQGLHGAAFDREFARYMVKDHEQDISDFQKEARGGHGQVRQLAKQTLPVLEKHLRLARALEKSGR